MLKLTNICDDPWTLEKFNNDVGVITEFLDSRGLDGLELIRWGHGQGGPIPYDRVVGKHLSFWPIWLDFWRGNRAELLWQFGNDEAIQQYYNAGSLDEFIANYRRELMDAADLNVQYVVFHVSHVQLEHCYTGQYTYSDAEIVDAFAELLNKILDGINGKFAVLLENHWYPGLTFLDGELANRLLGAVKYPNKGFVLDIGHLMNTNPDLSNEEQAVDYMLNVLGKLDASTRAAIKTIHLNSSLTGSYVKTAADTGYDPSGSFVDRLIRAMHHVGRIDRHAPFLHPSITGVIDTVKPEFLVYELSAATLGELEQAVDEQNNALGFSPGR
jgi:hypothetical protein